jgi:hypothetical protein
MFGRNYFAERDWIRAYDRDYSTWATIQERNGRDLTASPPTTAERDAIYTNLIPRYQTIGHNE